MTMNCKKTSLRCATLAMTVISIFLANQAKASLSDGLVSFWPLDTFDGSTTPDYASSNVLNVVGGITLVPSTVPSAVSGLFSNCFTFPSTLAYYTTSGAPTPSGLPIFKSAGGYTISMWVNAPTPTTATHYIYTEGSSSSANPILLIQTSSTTNAANPKFNKLDILVRNDAATAQLNHVLSSNVVFDGTWHHIAFCDNKGKTTLYVDGKVDGSGSNFNYTPAGTYTMNISTVGALIRNGVAANIYTGQIDNVAVWNRVLAQSEVQNFMSNSIPLPIVQSKPIFQSLSPSVTNVLGDYPPTFTLNLLGSNPISYQWYSNGVALLDQTSNSLTLNPGSMLVPGVTVFQVTATNFLGSFTTNVTDTVLADAAVNLSAGLMSYWPLDQINTDPGTTNMTTPDLYSHDDFILGATNGAAATITTPGEFTNAVVFDGSQAQYGVDYTGVPNFMLTNYSVSLWINGQPGNQPVGQVRVFSESSTNSGNPLFTIGTDTTGFLSSASILVRNDQGTTLVNNVHGALNVFDGNWHHVVWVDSNGSAQLYVDGVLDSTNYTYVRSGTFSMNATSIGAIVRATPGNFYTGNVDDVAVWNRRLTYSEIQALQTNTLPPPASITPPSIVNFNFQPPDPTNNLYIGDQLSFTVQAEGTAPLHYQWMKNGQPLDPAVNSTSTNAAFVITNAQTADSGAYTVVVSNSDPVLPGGGSVTSAVIQATVQAFVPATNGIALLMDVDALGSLNTQPGFVMYNTGLAGVGLTNGIRVAISAFNGGTLADRNRTPNIINGPGMTQAQIYNDFIFANATNYGSGLRISIQHLQPNTPYGVTIWSFDPVSAGNRVSDWTEVSSDPILIATNYTFNGSVPPTADYQDTIQAVLTSTPTGSLLIQGVTDTNNTSFAVFVNGIELIANPAPAPVKITAAGPAQDGNLQITTLGNYANQPISFIYSTTLLPNSWLPVTNAVLVTNIGTTAITEIPIAPGAQFFRAAGH